MAEGNQTSPIATSATSATIASGGKPATTPAFTSNKCFGVLECGTAGYEATKPPKKLTKRDCDEIKKNVREAEKSMGWIQWIASKDQSWRDPWVINARYQTCKSLPPELDEATFTTLRDRLAAYDRGDVKMTGAEAIELRRTVNLIQGSYDGVSAPYQTLPADYASAAEKEEFLRGGNNLSMAIAPTSAVGILLARAMGGTETQAQAAGELTGTVGALAAAVAVGGPRPSASTKPGASPGRGAVVKAFVPPSAAAVARRKIAEDFYRKKGFSEDDVKKHTKGIDFEKPVEVVTLKNGTEVVQYQVPGGRQGEYYTTAGTAPNTIGTSPQGLDRSTNLPVDRVATTYVVKGDVEVLRSTAAPIMDTWSLRPIEVPTQGGGTQYFSTDKNVFQPKLGR